MTQDRSKQAGILTTAEFIRFGCKSVIGIVLARILVPADLGSYRQLFLIYTTFSTLMLLGIPQSALYFLPKLSDPDSRRSFISRTLNLVTILALLFASGIFLFRGVVARAFSNPQLEKLLVLFAVYPLFMFITQIYGSIMFGLQQPARTARFTLFSVATDLLFILGLAFLTKDLQWIVLGVLLSALIQWGYTTLQLRRHYARVSIDPGFYREIFRYSLPLGLASIIGMLSIQLDKFVISGFFTPAQFAVFSIGAMELPFISILANSVNAILLPQISGDPAQLSSIYKAAVRKNALLVFPLSMLFFLLAEPLITIIYSQLYAASVPYFRVYLLILPLRVATYGIVFMALHKTRYIMVNSAVTLGLNLALNLILVRIMGMMGAAVATVIVTWISVGIYLYWIRNRLQLPLADLFPVPALLKTALTTLSAGLPAAVLIWWGPQNLPGQAAAGALFLVLYLVLGKTFGAILPYDIQYARKLLSQARSRFFRSQR